MKILKKICLALSFLFFSQTVLSLRTLEMIKISQLEDIKRISPFFFQTMLKWRMDVLPCVVMRFAGNVHAPCVNTITSPSLCHLQSDGDHWTISYTKQWESPREHYTTQHLFIVWFSSKNSIGLRDWCSVEEEDKRESQIFFLSISLIYLQMPYDHWC